MSDGIMLILGIVIGILMFGVILLGLRCRLLERKTARMSVIITELIQELNSISVKIIEEKDND